MKKLRILAGLFVGLLASTEVSPLTGWAQGMLTPPGAPAPVMKTLDQVQPHTPISALPFTITNSGSYYLTTNLVGVATIDSITINANDVTLDLNGFSMIGTGASQDGIYSIFFCTNVTIMNGHLDGWESGIALPVGHNVTVDHIDVANCSGTGITLGSQSFVRHCNVTDNFYGITTGGGTIIDAVATGNSGYGLYISGDGTIQDCRAVNNSYGGIYIQNGTIINCVSENNTNMGIYVNGDGLVKNCQANYNTSDGIFITRGTINDTQTLGNGNSGIYAVSDANLSGDTSSQNAGYGFFIGNHGSIHNCEADLNTWDNFNLNSGCSVSHCSATQSATGNGFYIGYFCTIGDSVAYSNKVNGIYALERSSVNSCTANWNGGAGIHANYIGTVQNCLCLENGTFGILCDGGGLINIIQNNCNHNGTNSFGGNPTSGAGIFITNSPYCHIENNMCVFNDYGIVVAASQHCLIIKNSATTSTATGFSMGTGNSYGPIVNVGAGGDMSTVTGANHPQANFNY